MKNFDNKFSLITNYPEETISGFISSGISVQVQCHHTKVLFVLLLQHDKKFSLRSGKIKIINSLLELKCPKHNLHMYNDEPEWLNANGS